MNCTRISVVTGSVTGSNCDTIAGQVSHGLLAGCAPQSFVCQAWLIVLAGHERQRRAAYQPGPKAQVRRIDRFRGLNRSEAQVDCPAGQPEGRNAAKAKRIEIRDRKGTKPREIRCRASKLSELSELSFFLPPLSISICEQTFGKQSRQRLVRALLPLFLDDLDLLFR